jgi:folate-binding protein YgfZ
MINFCTQHKDRKIIELSGADKAIFLQGLITQDVKLLDSTPIVYSLMLSPQGRFQFELFIIKVDEDLWLLDVEAEHAEAILKKLQMFKLRSAVNLHISNAWNVSVTSKLLDYGICVLDPRQNELGYRTYQKDDFAYCAEDFANYQNLRLILGVPEGSKDMIMDKSIPLEWNMESLHAISWDKGCYIGQELTARTKHVGTVRKYIIPIKFEKPGNYSKGCNLVQSGKIIGALASSDRNNGIALIQSDFDKSQKILLEAYYCYLITEI